MHLMSMYASMYMYRCLLTALKTRCTVRVVSGFVQCMSCSMLCGIYASVWIPLAVAGYRTGLRTDGSHVFDPSRTFAACINVLIDSSCFMYSCVCKAVNLLSTCAPALTNFAFLHIRILPSFVHHFC